VWTLKKECHAKYETHDLNLVPILLHCVITMGKCDKLIHKNHWTKKLLYPNSHSIWPGILGSGLKPWPFQQPLTQGCLKISKKMIPSQYSKHLSSLILFYKNLHQIMNVPRHICNEFFKPSIDPPRPKGPILSKTGIRHTDNSATSFSHMKFYGNC